MSENKYVPLVPAGDMLDNPPPYPGLPPSSPYNVSFAAESNAPYNAGSQSIPAYPGYPDHDASKLYNAPPPPYQPTTESSTTAAAVAPPHVVVIPGGQTTVVATSPCQTPYPTHTICPHCRSTIYTKTDGEAGCLTWLACLGLCLLQCWCGCCLIPCCISSCKDVRHECPNCNKSLGTFKRI